MPQSAAISDNGTGTNAASRAPGRYGMASATGTSTAVEPIKTRPGRLAKNGRRVRTTMATSSSVSSDSMNQPVRNVSADAAKGPRSKAKVTMSNTELSAPKDSMK